MAGVRDPAFWKRFSTAVHLDEEKAGPYAGNYAGAYAGNVSNEGPGWLARQQAKRSRRAWVCCCFWIGFGLFIVGVVAVVIWMLNSGILNNLVAGANPNGDNGGE